MFRTRRRTGILRERHSDTREKQRFEHLFRGAFLLGKDLIGNRHDFIGRVSGKFGNFRAIVFPRNEVGNLPVDERDVLAHHIAEARRLQFVGRVYQNFGIGNNDLGRFCGIRYLKIVIGKRGVIGGKTVHGCRRREKTEQFFLPCARHTAGIVHAARAYGDDAVRILQQPFGFFHFAHIRNAQIFVNLLRKRKTFRQQRVHQSFGGAQRIFVRHEQQILTESVAF